MASLRAVPQASFLCCCCLRPAAVLPLCYQPCGCGQQSSCAGQPSRGGCKRALHWAEINNSQRQLPCPACRKAREICRNGPAGSTVVGVLLLLSWTPDTPPPPIGVCVPSATCGDLLYVAMWSVWRCLGARGEGLWDVLCWCTAPACWQHGPEWPGSHSFCSYKNLVAGRRWVAAGAPLAPLSVMCWRFRVPPFAAGMLWAWLPVVA